MTLRSIDTCGNPKHIYIYTRNNAIIFKNSTTDLKLTVFIHIKIYNSKKILVFGLHFPASVA